MLASFFKKILKKKGKAKPGLLSVHMAQNGIAFVFYPKVTNPPAFSICDYTVVDNPGDIPALLKGFVAKHKLEGVETTIILDPSDYRLVYLDAPAVDENELGDASKWLVKEFIDFPVEEAVVDAYKVPVKEGQQAKMYAVVSRLSRIKQLVELFEGAGLTVEAIDIPELALRNFLSLVEVNEEETGLLYLQPAYHALLVVHKNNLCLSRSVETPMAYQNTEQEDDDESRERVAGEIERSVTFYQRQMGQGNWQKLWVLTLLKSQAAIIQSLSDLLSVSVEPLDANQYFTLEKPLDPTQQVLCLIAIGGALRLGWGDNATD